MFRTIAALMGVGMILAATGVRADELHTRDGRKLVGKLTDKGDHWEVKMAFGSVRVNKDNVDRIVRKKTDADRYEEKKQQIAPEDADGWFRLARWCQTQKLARWTRHAARKALALDSEHTGARALLGQVKVGQRWVDAATAAKLRAEQQAIEMRAQGKVRLGDAWVAPAEYKAAFRAAVERYNRGNQLLRAGQTRPAIDQYQAALERVPGFELARMRMALAWLYLKQGSRSIGILRKMALNNPDSATIRYNLAIAYETLKRYSDAFGAYEAALKINPRRRDAMRGILQLAKYLKRKKAIGKYELMRAEQLKEALLGLHEREVPDDHDLTITLQERPVHLVSRKLQRSATGGIKPVQVVQKGKQTPLSNARSRSYRYRVARPEAVDSTTFLAHNTRLRKMATYPVYIDDFRKGGWAFEFRQAPLIRLKIMRFVLERGGQVLPRPAGRLTIRYLSFQRVEYRDGQVVDGVTEVNLTIWREFKAEDWPEQGFLALPACVADAVEIEFTFSNGTRVKEASVYDHDRGIVRKISAADWKAAADRARPPAGARDARGRAVKLFGELRDTMAGYKQAGTDPKAAAVRTWTERWEKRVGRLRGEVIDPDVRLALADMRILRAELEAALGGAPSQRAAFLTREIKRQLRIQ